MSAGLQKSPKDSMSDLVKLQFDYAWKWFSFHADQRVKMFNFMLVAFGIFATAVVSSLDKHLPTNVSAALCVIAGVLALIFVFLDGRNGYLVRLGEEVLVQLERRNMFKGDQSIEDRWGATVPFGILLRQEKEDSRRPFNEYSAVWLGRHRFWLRAVGVLFAVSFFAAAFFIKMTCW
jgi:hypothetical protein